jgi:hypothetical protein
MTNPISFPLRLGSSARTASGKKTANWKGRNESWQLAWQAGKMHGDRDGTDPAARYVTKLTSTTSIKIHNY